MHDTVFHFKQVPGTNTYLPCDPAEATRVIPAEAFTMVDQPLAAARWGTFEAPRAVPHRAATHLAHPEHKPADNRARVAFQATLKRFVAEFGVQCGTQYAADGLTFEQAKARHANYVECVRRFGDLMAVKDREQARAQQQLTTAVGAGPARFAASLTLPK
jgi:hypothetical protein